MMSELPPELFSHLRAAFNQGFVAIGVCVNIHRGDSDEAAMHLKRFAGLEESADLQERTEYACREGDSLPGGRGCRRGSPKRRRSDRGPAVPLGGRIIG